MRKEGEEVSCIAKHDGTWLSACVEDAGALICKLAEVERPGLSAFFFTSGVVTEHAVKDGLFIRFLLQSLFEVEFFDGSLRKTFDKLLIL